MHLPLVLAAGVASSALVRKALGRFRGRAGCWRHCDVNLLWVL